MGKIMIYRDLVNSVLGNPRDVTLFGDEDIISTRSGSYDLYHSMMEGTSHSPGIDSRFKVIPVFLDPGSVENLAEKLEYYYAQYQNSLVGVCAPEGIFGFSQVDKTEKGVEFGKIIDYSAVDEKKLVSLIEKERAQDILETIKRSKADLSRQVTILSS
ncbi:MAG: hypothetical protein ABIH72_00880 [archaeon]